VTAASTTPEREAVLRRLVALVLGVAVGHPVRVAIDGPDAAGKSTLAAELVERIARRGRQAVGLSADDFANPRSIRYRQGRDSPAGYEQDTLDVEALRARLLLPAGPGGDRAVRLRWWDVDADAPAVSPAVELAPDAVLVVDGVFLGRSELAGAFDLRIFVAVEPAECLRRALARDVPRLGPADEVEARYRARYLPAQVAYAARDAAGTADAVVRNDDPDRPILRMRG
jgi:uridine kinase